MTQQPNAPGQLAEEQTPFKAQPAAEASPEAPPAAEPAATPEPRMSVRELGLNIALAIKAIDEVDDAEFAAVSPEDKAEGRVMRRAAITALRVRPETL